MDLTQTKLTKAEWLSVEIAVSPKEREILSLICKGFHDVNVRENATSTLASLSKIDLQDHLYDQYLAPLLHDLSTQYGLDTPTTTTTASKSKSKSKKPLKTRDAIRMQSFQLCPETYELVVINFCRHVLENHRRVFYVYTLMQMQKAQITNVHPAIPAFVETVLARFPIPPREFLRHAPECIERNPHLFQYADKTLFDHQKQLFHLFRQQPSEPKLVFYTAPTGTGKTLSPLGLSEGYRVIFICAARHVGLALAKSAVSMQKRIAVAFGCETASDIRLHYFAASEYTRNKRTGGIGKVDNSVGDKVQIMICDVKSYVVAQHYMLAFSAEDNDDLVTYWDEPTITMDYVSHPLHDQIRRNWQENKISRMVLSCATLPAAEELVDVIRGFQVQFPGATHHTIRSFASSKSISLLNTLGAPVLPHMLDNWKAATQHCLLHLELLRYMDLAEIVRFIEEEHEHEHCYLDDGALHVDTYFADKAMTMHSIKEYYLVLLQRSPSGTAALVAAAPRFRTNGTLLTTQDAHTLTDGPTIFLAEDVEKVGRFFIQQSNIPVAIFQQVAEKIAHNSKIQRRVDELEKVVENVETAESNREQNHSAEKTTSKKQRDSQGTARLLEQMDELRMQIRNVALDNVYLPNTVPHQRAWSPTVVVPNAFVSSVDEASVREIMALDVTDQMKLLLLMGVGMFVNDFPAKYVEIMKRLASEQRLFLILASSDYVYGTNYSFCHGFIGKDLTNMTYQKTIQAMGRIGRNHMQQEYTIRFRDDDMLTRLFLPSLQGNPEADKMNELFSREV